MIKNIECIDLEVTEIISLHKNFYKLRLTPPKWDWNVGQFVMIRPNDWGFDPFLPRPFSISQLDDEKLEIFFQVVGRGTYLLSHLKPKNKVKVWGPLGKGFKINLNLPILIIAGGMGIAPFVGFIKNHPNPEKIEVIFGHRMPLSCYPISEFPKQILIWTIEDKNEKDLEKLKRAIKVKIEGYSSDGQILACGPLPFLKMIFSECYTKRTHVQFSLERPMACGIGACLSCVIPSPHGENFKVCMDGPVFLCEDLSILFKQQPLIMP